MHEVVFGMCWFLAGAAAAVVVAALFFFGMLACEQDEELGEELDDSWGT